MQTDHSQNAFYKYSQTFISFYGLKWRSKYESQKIENLIVLFVFLIYICDISWLEFSLAMLRVWVRYDLI